MPRCEHRWEWIKPVIHTIWHPYPPWSKKRKTSTYNVVCTRCGDRNWAHGRNHLNTLHRPHR